MTRSLTHTWGLAEQRGKRGDVRYTLSDRGIRYITLRDRAQLATTMATWSTEPAADSHGQPRPLGHRILTWQRQTGHADGITWFLSELAAEARAEDASELRWSMPTARSDRAFNRGEDAIAPDAVGHLLVNALHVPFYLEHELRARHPRGVAARLRPYIRYYRSDAPRDDQPPFPTTLFVVDTEDVAETYASTASRMPAMKLPILVSSRELLSYRGMLGRSWRPLWDAACAPGAQGTGGKRVGQTAAADASAGDTAIMLIRYLLPALLSGGANCHQQADFGVGWEAAMCHFPGFHVGNGLSRPLTNQELHFGNYEKPR